MRQQFRQEKSTETVRRAPVVTPETKISEGNTSTVAERATIAQPRTGSQGWPFLVIGVFLIACAGIAFAVSLDFLKMSPEMTLDIDRTLGTNTLTDFYVRFFGLLWNLIVAAIYISYGLWLRKHGTNGPLPAFLAFYRKRLAKAPATANRSLAASAWVLRLFVLFMAATFLYFNFSILFYPPGIQHTVDAHMIISIVNNSINVFAEYGLLWILASTIYPIRGRKQEQ